eukprot:1185196-Rhodomonas_salina.1
MGPPLNDDQHVLLALVQLPRLENLDVCMPGAKRSSDAAGIAVQWLLHMLGQGMMESWYTGTVTCIASALRFFKEGLFCLSRAATSTVRQTGSLVRAKTQRLTLPWKPEGLGAASAWRRSCNVCVVVQVGDAKSWGRGGPGWENLSLGFLCLDEEKCPS